MSLRRCWLIRLRELAADAVEARFRNIGAEVVAIAAAAGTSEDAQAVCAALKNQEPAWLALDGYDFNVDYQKAVAKACFGLLIIDDGARIGNYMAQVILDQNLGSQEAQYQNRPASTVLLLGCRFALLRGEFSDRRLSVRQPAQSVKKILVTLGGGDSQSALDKVLASLSRVAIQSAIEVDVVLGPAAIRSAIQTLPLKAEKFSVRWHYDASNMADLIAQADLAISGGGSTCYELAVLGAPAITLELADNQRVCAQALSDQGAVKNLGPINSLSESQLAQEIGRLSHDWPARCQMSKRAQHLVDGQGAYRVVKQLLAQSIQLRPVIKADSEILWKWANDPEVRAHSFSPIPISWDEHVRWFEAKQAEPSCQHFIILDSSRNPAGQIRFDREGDSAEISVSLGKANRGLGLSAAAIELASRRFFEAATASSIIAYVKPENHASLRAFERAGFSALGMVEKKGHRVQQFRFQRQPASEPAWVLA